MPIGDTPDDHLQRLEGLEQELDALYGHLGLPRPEFGALSVRRRGVAPARPTAAERAPRRILRRPA